jgi:8-oxo-dGTP diphosphatase
VNHAQGTAVVVGAVLVRSGRMLAARRSAPADLAGGWELPGGKVDPGETERQAVVREIREELGVDVRPIRRLDGEEPLGQRFVLRAWLVEGVDESEPVPLEDHDLVRWLHADELDDVAWLPADRPFLRQIHEILTLSG